MFSRTSVALGFIGWMAYIFCIILQDHTYMIKRKVKLDTEHFDSPLIKGIFITLGCVVIALLISK